MVVHLAQHVEGQVDIVGFGVGAEVRPEWLADPVGLLFEAGYEVVQGRKDQLDPFGCGSDEGFIVEVGGSTTEGSLAVALQAIDADVPEAPGDGGDRGRLHVAFDRIDDPAGVGSLARWPQAPATVDRFPVVLLIGQAVQPFGQPGSSGVTGHPNRRQATIVEFGFTHRPGLARVPLRRRRVSDIASGRGSRANTVGAMTDSSHPTREGLPGSDIGQPPPVRVGLLGCGNVGASLVGLLTERADATAADAGIRIELAGIAVRSTTKDRLEAYGQVVDPGLLTTDAEALVRDPSIDVVVELIGGIEPARSLILDSLKARKPVVTGNKELLANHGAELYGAAEAAGVDLLFEAAAAGAIPIIRPLRESLLGEEVRAVMGIVNGTTNYILTRMTEEGVAYGEVLAEAQRLGYAERDPTADVEGYDAGAKAAIMASIAFGANVVAGDVYHEGIGAISAEDIEFGRRFNYTIKPLAIAERFESPDGGSEIGVRVYPAMVPDDHPLASVRGSFNAVFIDGGAAGELMFYGRGAGGLPTASAVMGDLIDAAVNLRRGTFRPVPSGPRARIRPIDDLETAYYIGLTVDDSPGVLSKVSGAFGSNDVSILAMQQEAQQPDHQGTQIAGGGAGASGGRAKVAFITHVARERDVQATLAELRQLDEVHDVQSLLRVVGN